MSEAAWPFLVLLLAGVLPNELFRVAAVLAYRGIDPGSEFFRWIRIVATTLLAAVVSRLVYAPGAALAAVPIWVPIAAIAVGTAAFFAFRRSLLPGILAGEAFFVAATYLAAPP